MAICRAAKCAAKSASESGAVLGLILAAFATPASASTIAQWGDSTTRGGTGYVLTLDETDHALADGWERRAAWGWKNDEVWGTGHSRQFSGILEEGIAWSITIDTTWNSAGVGTNTPDLWQLDLSPLPAGYVFSFGLATAGTGIVDEWSWDYAELLYRAPDEPVPPAPVPLPAAGGLLLAALVALRAWGRRERAWWKRDSAERASQDWSAM